MMPPKQTVEPKDRVTLWKETIVGGVLFLVGLVVVGGYVWHQLSSDHLGHQPEVTVLGIGVGAIVLGMWWMNRKLTREMMRDLIGWAKFWQKPDA